MATKTKVHAGLKVLKVAKYSADRGSLRIDGDCTIFFNNGVGDGSSSVSLAAEFPNTEWEIVSGFRVNTAAAVSSHDGDYGKPTIKLQPGMYFVYRHQKPDRTFCDGEMAILRIGDH